MPQPYQLEQSVIDAFQLMWGNFPAPVTLVHKSRRVVAANPEAIKFGREPGCICSQQGPPESHANCLADKALADGKIRWDRRKKGENDLLAYWLPLEGYPEFFVHLGILVTDPPQS